MHTAFTSCTCTVSDQVLLLYILPHYSVPSAPLELRVEDVSSRGFTLEWNPPSTPNGIIDLYQLELFAANNLELPAMNLINVNSTSYTFTGLAPFTGYSVQVCAYTIGCGDIATLNVTTLGGEGENVFSNSWAECHTIYVRTCTDNTLHYINT